ncbi:cyclin-C-like isoform X2 [Leptotrombidium deliense]|uniref:Cyclin-C-like isoform X2 n=1 Tax=Leptotrombidium deliense TaxID=299467 RepID=A0A443SMD3_9ACAR|nr:cyclin-C-like isoform X2 [Leptotrombidium deliense]
MAGNFWQSSHFQQWLLDRQDLVRERQLDLQILNENEYQKLFIFFANFIQALGEQLKVKQQVISTAIVYFKRFYVRNSLKCIDPLLVAPTCVFLASKVEEFGIISNNRLMSTCQTVGGYIHSYDCCLIVYHPYRPLVQYIQDLKESRDSKEHSKESKDDILNISW